MFFKFNKPVCPVFIYGSEKSPELFKSDLFSIVIDIVVNIINNNNI